MSGSGVECEDFGFFQEALKTMRKTDDLIVSTINTAVPTDSFHADEVAACKNLHKNLEEGNNKRSNFIKNCISITTSRVKKLKDQRDTQSDDVVSSKELRAEQTKLRMLQVELTVEDLIKERTAKVFNERCRRFYKPL